MAHLIEHVDFQDLLHAVSILDKQKSMIRFLNSYPLIREKILEIQDFDVSKVKEHLENAKKMLQKINDIFLFEDYEADPKNNLQTSQIRDLITALMMQYEFLH